MKIKFHYIITVLISLVVVSCAKDNYDAPTIKLSGQLTYQGAPIGVETNQVPFSIYEPAFGKKAPIGGIFAPDGSFSSLLFKGKYKFTISANQGPFMWKELGSGKRDSLDIDLTGNQELMIEVMPYYMIRTPQFTASAGNLSATFKVEKIITDANAKNIERVNLYINKTSFVSGNNDENIAKIDLAGSAIVDPNSISLSVAIPTTAPIQNYVYARIGVKISGVEDMIFSPVQKVSF